MNDETSKLIAKVERFARQEQLFAPAEPGRALHLCAAVSGGADSMALLRVLPTDQALLADDAALQTDIPIRRVLSALTMLEIDGYVRRQGAGSFLRTVELKEE